jgi:hypothetical protein
MSDSVETKADSTAAPKKAAVVKKKAKKGNGVAVKNISNRIINTSKGSIKPQLEGFATEAECVQLNKFLERTY